MERVKSQREKIDEVMQRTHAPGAGEMSALRKLLRETQNMPPHGENDGSVGWELWGVVKRVVDSSEDLVKALNDWEGAVESDRPPPESA